jgi:c-di-GMP-binding flagellar brake protein YcgR
MNENSELTVGFPGPPVDATSDQTPSGVEEDRRRFLRVPKRVDLDIRHRDTPIRAQMVDLSEGGFRCRFTGEPDLETGDILAARLHVGDAELSVSGRIAWERFEDPTREIGICFVGLTEKETQRIRSHVFALQLQERRLERGHRGDSHRHHHHHR